MIIRNITRNSTLENNLCEAQSLTDKILGLHKSGKFKSLLIKTRFGIHTFFLKYPIDVIVLDSKNHVVKAKTVLPNSIFLYNPKHINVLELPSGAIAKSKTQIGDQLSLK